MKQARKTVKKFRKAYDVKGAPNICELKQILKRLSFEVCAYSESTNKLYETKTFDLAEKKPAFTYIRGNKKYVFYDDLLNEVDTERVLAHEIGHLYCNHMYRKDTPLDSDINKEWEANLFASYLLEPSSYKIYIGKWLPILIVVFVFFTSYISYSVAMQPPGQKQGDCVYITPTGHSYHATNCQYGEIHKNSISIKRTDAERHYLPCSLCNPDK